jgi:hypothetical protein
LDSSGIICHLVRIGYICEYVATGSQNFGAGCHPLCAAQLIAEIDEFKGKWEALSRRSRERLLALRDVATVESVASSTRIEGVKLTDQEVEALLSNLQRYTFRSRDEQEVACYTEALDLVFQSWEQLTLTKNHLS